MDDVIHQCCGCSCDVCSDGHNSVRPMRGHTTECFLRFMDEQDSGNPKDSDASGRAGRAAS